jgi:hypothetical protein
VETKPIPHAMNQRTNNHFRFCILASYSRHVKRALLFCEDINH